MGDGFLLVALFLFLISMIFMVFGYLSKRDDDEGSASKYLSIGIVILILDVIYFLVIVNVFQLYE
jgi:uncharacterized ion transporter superfamily protein YfcC